MLLVAVLGGAADFLLDALAVCFVLLLVGPWLGQGSEAGGGQPVDGVYRRGGGSLQNDVAVGAELLGIEEEFAVRHG